MKKFRLVSAIWLLGLLAACAGQEAATVPEDILFQDQFIPGESGDWLLEGDDLGRTAVIDQKLVITINQPNTMQYAALSEPVFTHFSLEVQAQQTAGNPESSYGLLVGLTDSGSFYRFEITSNGLYMIERHNGDGSWRQYLGDWTPSPAINQGLNTSNQLKVEVNGSSLSFYVNGNLLHEILEDSVTPGAIALDAGTFGQTGLQVVFDNVVVRDLALAED